ncbi:hypothetical protein EJB05_29387, partial [Eragrostis curvula]
RLQMESEARVNNLLELMLIDENAEPAALSLSLLKSITNNFSDELKIGSGGFAVVYKGKLENGTVAVKRLEQTLDTDETQFHQEVDSLMRVKHKNIVRFMGYCSDTQGKVWKLQGKNVMAEERQRFLCFEFLPQGSLDKHISDATHGLEWMERYRIIKGICEGLHYLHHGDQKKIIHCDLKPANILLDHDMNPKITDFGLSRLFDDNQTRAMTSNVMGTLGYMAPEYLRGQITLKSDIYSLGVIIIEILTGQKEYPKIDNVLESWSTVSLEDTLLESVRACAEIGIECIESNPENRPGTESIIERLAEMEHTYALTLPQINAYDKVKLEIMGRVKWIPLTKSAKDLPVLVRVVAPRKCTESSRVGLDLVAVLCISRHMMLLENRMDSMKEAMMFVIDNLGPDDRLSVVSFNDETKRLTELSVMTDMNRERVRREVCMLVPKGGTNMGPALNEAAKILGQRGPEERRNRVGRIILLSDYEDPSFKLRDICPEFPVDTFGLGIEHELDDLSQIAKCTKGLYSYVYQDLEKIKDAFAQSLGGLMSVFAMDVQVNLQTLDGIYISSIKSGSYPMQISSDNRSAIIQLPDLYAGEKKNFIVHLNVPKGEQNQLMKITGSYRNPKISKEAPIQLDDTQLAVLRSKWPSPSDKSICPNVAIELVRWRLLHTLQKGQFKGFEDSWNELMDSEEWRSSPQSAVLALDKDLAEIQRGDGESFMFLLSWLSSHSLQRATTKKSPSKSSAFRVKAMQEMLIKADKEPKRLAEPKRLPESTGSDEKVKLEIMPGDNSISSTMGANEFPVLVRVTAPLLCTKSSRAGLDLVVVLHVGSSMLQGNRFDFMKQAMLFVIDNLGRSDRLSVISFNNETRRLTELSFMTEVNRERARHEVCMLVPGGGTDAGPALIEASKIMHGLEELIMNRVSCLLCLFDCQNESIFEDLSAVMGASVNTDGVQENFLKDMCCLRADHETLGLSCIAVGTMGFYSYVTQDLEGIKNAIALSLGRFMSVTTMDIEIKLQTLDGVTISNTNKFSSIKSGRYESGFSFKRRSGTIQVPDLYAGEQKNFLVYLDVPKGPQYHLITVGRSYTKPMISRKNTIQLDDSKLVVFRPKVATTSPDETVCPDVAAELIRLRLIELVCSVVNSEELSVEELQRSWEEIKGSRDGFNSPQSMVLALDEDVAMMQRTNDRMFIWSWIRCHFFQRPNKKADGEQTSLPESTSSDHEVPEFGTVAAESRGDLDRKLVQFDGPLAFTGHNLWCAPAKKIGKSTYGPVYMVTLEDGSLVAIKWLWEITEDNKEFEEEATVLGNIQHPNILALGAYYLDLDPMGEKLLIFDYMPKGSLSAFLHDRDVDMPVEWKTRMTIAKGTPCGLAYLHDDMSIIHGNLTARNVLLDEQCNPKVADFGLYRMMKAEANSAALAAAGKLGYQAPELSMLEEANAKTDVYSLGVIILELLTGKCPADSTNGMDLPQWVASMVKEERTRDVFDRELMRDELVEWTTVFNHTLELALQCVDPSPSVRPEAREVLRQLEQVSKLVHFDVPLASTWDDLLYAPMEFIGKSRINTGTVCKLTLEDGSMLAIKRLMRENIKAHNEFEAEAAVLGKIRHPNLLALRAYCKGAKVLFMDYMPRGSLSAFRHGQMSILYHAPDTMVDWTTRMTIAKGMARGLAYLHDDMSIIHGNLAARNVLLDEQCNPKVADFGLYRMMTAEANSAALATAGKLGYQAPELEKLEEANAKTDVYSMGVIIMELLTGRSPAKMDLPQWLACIDMEGWNIELLDIAKDELVPTLKLALRCVDPSPSVRPEAREVLRQLEQINPGSDGGVGPSEEGHLPLSAGGGDRSEAKEAGGVGATAGGRGEKPGSGSVDAESRGDVGRKLVHFDGLLAFTAGELMNASGEAMWKGTYGTVHKATLEDGSVVALQRLRENIKGHNEFEAEAAVLGKIRHPNLLALRAYYMDQKAEGEKLLVFDYMPKGSLPAFLHGQMPRLCSQSFALFSILSS